MEPDLLSLIRRADVVLLVVDLQTFPIQQLEDSLAILQEHRIFPNHAEIPEADRHRIVSKPFIVVANKCDDERLDEDCEVLGELIGEEWHIVPVSATTGRNLDRLRWAVFDRLEIVRVYSKPPGKEPDRTAPFVLAKGSTVEEFAAGVHQDFVETLTSARIWGAGVYDGQQVGRDHVLSDGDVVELRT
jgi:ribosome-interacting GTPase 1